ncbi:hypothetical protein KAW18_01450 [candidate division WOR-3 bacterium]|nr:hypothetical protein [candidate division WOR-3 bacterium]
MTKRKKDRIQKALSYDPFFDTDNDGVPNILDCRPLDPTRDGFFGDLGGAIKRRFKPSMIDYKRKKRDGILEDVLQKKTDPSILDYKPRKPRKLERDGLVSEISGAIKTRVKGEVGEAKERLVKGIAGEEVREERKTLREAEHEAYLEEAKEQIEERGREKARAKFERRKPLLGGLLGGTVDVSEFGEDVKETIKKAGKHGKGILKETARSRIKTRTPDVKLPDISLGGTGMDVLSGTLRTIKPTKRKTEAKIGTKMPDVQMPDVRW